ncbi:MAG: leucine--tRNA ligase [Proteobacteria bacterium]|nr:leucine--tRNA ligase [Pseudomonadota bacterium]
MADHDAEVEVFTTRQDTLFGCGYMVLAPEHPLVARITTEAEREAVEAYVAQSARKSERARQAELEEKTGVATGAFALHPVTGERLPVWVADYVLASYGTGAVMGVAGHDERDYAFAKQFGLPILEVVAGGDLSESAFTGDGVAVHSQFLDGLATPDAKRKMNEWLEANGKGEAAVTYKLRDWLFSRQRYWGEPLPVLHREDGSIALLPEDELPLLLPELDDFKPSGDFQAPLARVADWVATRDPETGAPARRDTNTMPQWAGSCWYFLRFLDPSNEDEPWSREAEQYWMPVDLYVGGAEHAVLHLLYARFWHKVFYDLGLVHTKEPFQRLLNQGMIQGSSFRYYDDNVSDAPDVETKVYSSSDVLVQGESTSARGSGDEVKARWVHLHDVQFTDDGTPVHPDHPGLVLEPVIEKMSKSRGNVLSPDEVVAEYGADAMRLYEMFIGPLEKEAPWSVEGIQGVSRFLQRAWRLFIEGDGADERVRELAPGAGTQAQARLAAETIAGVTRDMEGLRFNTAISKLMVYAREVTKDAPLPREGAEAFLKLLSPLAAHLAEELWQRLGHAETIAYETWPEADESLLVDDQVTLVVQVNGKRRDQLEVATDADREAVEAAALALPKVQKHLAGRAPKKVIVVPGRLVNIVG